MSIGNCHCCGRRFDMDVLESHVVIEHKYGDRVLCLTCGEEEEADQNEADRMAWEAEQESLKAGPAT